MANNQSRPQNRPLSPHLMQYRWGVHMMVSIVHRLTGFILATAGMMTLIWWLSAISAGADATGLQIACNWFFRLTAFAVTYAFFQHFYSGLRHLVMDMGAGFELKTNRMWSQVVFVAAFLTTMAISLFVASRFLGV
jgi:succinate dehydrogenase / fumarate reductase, cytochrome b subunit